jgi:hypothetical protein
LLSQLQFTGHYGATAALQLLGDPTGHCPFTAQTGSNPVGEAKSFNNLQVPGVFMPYVIRSQGSVARRIKGLWGHKMMMNLKGIN